MPSKNESLKNTVFDKFEENEFAYNFMAFTIWALISDPGTRFPRAACPRLAPAGSPLEALFPQESRTFLYNQLRFKIQIEIILKELKVLLL
jgi:hypothetical protein